MHIFFRTFLNTIIAFLKKYRNIQAFFRNTLKAQQKLVFYGISGDNKRFLVDFNNILIIKNKQSALAGFKTLVKY